METYFLGKILEAVLIVGAIYLATTNNRKEG